MSENNQYEILWKKIREILQASMSTVTYNTYISKLVPVDIDGTKIVLKTDTEFFANYIGKSLTEKIKEAFKKADTGITDFELVVEGNDEVYFTSVEEEDGEDCSPVTLDPRFTFESFVAGKSNEFVFAAAKSVAQSPGANFNPLYIYGTSGLGKTHLLQSIANYINLHKPRLRVLYTTCEKFINEFIDSLYLKKGNNRDMQARFRNRYRGVDVLLIDDVQFLAKTKVVQEELFHTFNALKAENKQIVLTSDRPPSEMTQLEDRLRTRFEWGLLVDVAPPDFETRLAIVKNKAALLGMELPDKISAYIAENVTANVRQLEGTINKILAYKDLLGNDTDEETVTRAIQDMLRRSNEYVPTPEAILEYISKYYSLDESVIRGQQRVRDAVSARQIAMYLIRSMTNLSLDEIGKVFDNRDHSTVLYSIQQIEKKMKKDASFAEMVKEIKTNINSKR